MSGYIALIIRVQTTGITREETRCRQVLGCWFQSAPRYRVHAPYHQHFIILNLAPLEYAKICTIQDNLILTIPKHIVESFRLSQQID